MICSQSGEYKDLVDFWSPAEEETFSNPSIWKPKAYADVLQMYPPKGGVVFRKPLTFMLEVWGPRRGADLPPSDLTPHSNYLKRMYVNLNA